MDESAIMSVWKREWWTWPTGDCDPRTEPGIAPAYWKWMSRDVDQPAPYVQSDVPINSEHLMSLVRFRLGVHHLRVATGRWTNTPREQRICPRCTVNGVEDELHVMFECPGYARERERFRHLFTNTGGPRGQDCMRMIMLHPDQAALAALVHAIDLRHQEPLCDVLVDAFQDDIW